MSTSLDLSRVPAPDAIEPLSFELLTQNFLDRFRAAWAAARLIDPTLPDYNVQMLAYDPVVIVGQAFSYLRLLDRQRVNDAIKAVLAPLASGTNLDNVVARQGVQRLVVVPANVEIGTPAVMETDAALLRRYLLSFDRPGAGTAGRYLFEAFTAWPAMLDARVNGFAVHGRRGDTDVVIIGPNGDLATAEEKAAAQNAVLSPSVKPEAVSVAVLDATRLEYSVDLVLEIPQGPDAAAIRTEAIARVQRAGDARTVIGGEVPAGYIAGAAYDPNVIKVRDMAPVAIAADPYTVPVLVDIAIAVEVRP